MGPNELETGQQLVDRFLLAVANALTLGRLLSTPLLVWALLQTPEQRAFDWWALGLIVALQTSDVLDGRLARLAGSERAPHGNVVGEILDPVADKVYLNSAFITLMAIGRTPLWVGATILARDLLIILGWLARYYFSGVRLRPNALGKAADSTQAVLLVAILLRPPAPLLTICYAAALALTALSGVVYARVALQPRTQAR